MAVLKEFGMDEEFTGLNFRSVCLESRFVRTMKTLMDQPDKSIWEASKDRAEAKAIYRMLGNRKLSREEILRRHREAVARRIIAHGGSILLVQDTVGLNYGTHWKTKGMGYIGDNTLGVNVRTCLAVSGDGMILGLLDQSSHSGQNPMDKPVGGNRDKRKVPEETMEPVEMESSRWFETLKKSKAGIPKGINVIALRDGGGDVYELFAKASALGNALLVRVMRDGMTEENRRILKELRNKPSQGQVAVVIPGDSRDVPERKAVFQLWYAPFTISNPHPDPAQTLPNSVTVSAIYVKETQPPSGKEPIEWFLMTSDEVSSPQEARKYTAYYTRRQLTARFHHVLKNGCAIEKLQERSVEKTAMLVLMYSIISVMMLNQP